MNTWQNTPNCFYLGDSRTVLMTLWSILTERIQHNKILCVPPHPTWFSIITSFSSLRSSTAVDEADRCLFMSHFCVWEHENDTDGVTNLAFVLRRGIKTSYLIAASRRGTDMLWRSSLPPPEANRAVEFPPVSASLSPLSCVWGFLCWHPLCWWACWVRPGLKLSELVLSDWIPPRLCCSLCQSEQFDNMLLYYQVWWFTSRSKCSARFCTQPPFREDFDLCVPLLWATEKCLIKEEKPATNINF